MTGPATGDAPGFEGRPPQPTLWIDWHPHLRTHSLARRLGAELLEIDIRRGRLQRYARSMMRTARSIHSRRPRVVIATNPSIVLAYGLLLLRMFYRYKLVADAHFLGVQALRAHGALQPFLDHYNRRADLVIVTNEHHAQRVEQLGGRSFVCPDPVPQLSVPAHSNLSLPEKSVLLVCSFDVDEPYLEAFRAFEDLQQDGYTLFVSGNYRRAQVDPPRFPWVRFLGFVPTDAFYAHFTACAVVMDLTSAEDCLVCGAYEAMALGKPLVLSETKALAGYFGRACVLTANTPTAIAAGVREAYARRDELVQLTQEWTQWNSGYMQERITGLRDRLSALAA